MPMDPVCGVLLDEDEATTAAYRGQKYFFCCDDCREEFLETPEEYAGDSMEMFVEDEE